MTYTYSTDRLVKIDGKWIRASAVQAVVKTPFGRTGIHLANGVRIEVGDNDGSISPDDVAHKIAGKEDR